MLIDDGCQSFEKPLKIMREQSEFLSSADTGNLTVTLEGIYWSAFLMWKKGVLRLPKLGKTVLSSFLPVLISQAAGTTLVSLLQLLNQAIH